MENASKALIMAASILIGIIILSLAVYLFVTFGTSSAEMHKQVDADRLNQFNSQFTSYEGKEDITIYDVITVANLATENNKYYEFQKRSSIPSNSTNDNYVFVCIKKNNTNQNIEFGIKDASENINSYYSKMINEELNNINGVSTELSNYSCKTSISQITGRIYKVQFTKK